jgi:hypothetical protein
MGEGKGWGTLDLLQSAAIAVLGFRERNYANPKRAF